MYVKSHSINALTHTIIMVQSIGGILLTVGGVGLLASIFFLSTLDYNGPPIPAGYLVGLIAITLGAGVTLGASLLSWREKTHVDHNRNTGRCYTCIRHSRNRTTSP